MNLRLRSVDYGWFRRRKTPQKIKITAGKDQVEALQNDSPTAKSIVDVLPIKVQAQRRGGEVYFSIPRAAVLEK